MIEEGQNEKVTKEYFQTKVNDKWVIGSKLGQGSFGDIFLATDLMS
jgi:hypothetical protein